MHDRYTGPRLRLAADVLRRAQLRGEIRPEVDPEAVVDQLWGAAYHRLLLTGMPLTSAFAGKLLDNLLSGNTDGGTPDDVSARAEDSSAGETASRRMRREEVQPPGVLDNGGEAH